jgi:transposase-like protein
MLINPLKHLPEKTEHLICPACANRGGTFEIYGKIVGFHKFLYFVCSNCEKTFSVKIK